MTTNRIAPFIDWTEPALERELLDDITLDVPWSVVERFSSLVRLSGSAEEQQAIDILMTHLRDWDIPHRLYEPEAFISWPLSASVREVGAGTSFRAKTPAMSVSTHGSEVIGPLVY